MNSSVIGRYLVGRRSAIQEIAANGAALWTGLILVLLTGIARNYDQNYILETPLWLIGPLLFSFFSGSFLFGVLILGFARRHHEVKPPIVRQWMTFMGLFWMTAPIAWLYAIPVERFFDSYAAARANLTLLAIVSIWRVLLMSRVLEVLLGISFRRALGWVLLAAAIEIVVVVFFGFASAQHIMAGMSGMRDAPEETLVLNTLFLVWVASWIAIVIVAISLRLSLLHETLPPLPSFSRFNWPVTFLAGATVFWILIAIPAQREQERFDTHARLVEEERYREALAYLGNFQLSDFPPGRRIEPSPYEYRVWEHLPPIISLLNTNTPAWIRGLYLSHWSTSLAHHHSNFQSLTNVASMFAALEALPEGRAWLKGNEMGLARAHLYLSYTDTTEHSEVQAQAKIEEIARRMGMAETSLAQMFR